MIHFEDFTHLTFDCYGTLIDWESGILAAVRPVLRQHGLITTDAQILALYTKFEAAQEVGPYQSYRVILRNVMADIAAEVGFAPTEAELDVLPDSVGAWPAFADTVAALKRLQTRYKLVIISNIDDAMFAESNKRLQVTFDDIITAQQVGSYKPAYNNFQTALKRLGVVQPQVLHVAQSLYHDHVPAKELGFTTVWVNRKSILPGIGLSLPVAVTPDLEVPDMQSLVAAIGLA
ncbi:MAG: haloacid dehalogenase type II [Chloroflexi bacterium]|nr:haloacid dehalogenase type II [Chloroflexota bacterium]